MGNLSKKYGFENHYTSPNTHNANGQVERVHRILNEKLVMTNKVREWDIYLPELQRVINMNKHAVTGYQPFYLMFERMDNSVGDLSVLMKSKLCKDDLLRLMFKINHLDFMDSTRKIIQRNLVNQRAYEKRGKPNSVDFKKGDKVMMRTYYDKFKNAYMGPFLVEKVMEDNTLLLKALDDSMAPFPFKAHRSQLKVLRKEE